jgi:hypothetical protein
MARRAFLKGVFAAPEEDGQTDAKKEASSGESRVGGWEQGVEEEDVEWWHKWRENRVELDPIVKGSLASGLGLPPERPFGLSLGGAVKEEEEEEEGGGVGGDGGGEEGVRTRERYDEMWAGSRVERAVMERLMFVGGRGGERDWVNDMLAGNPDRRRGGAGGEAGGGGDGEGWEGWGVDGADSLQVFRVWGLLFRVWGLGSGLWGLGIGDWGLGFGVWGLGFKV